MFMRTGPDPMLGQPVSAVVRPSTLAIAVTSFALLLSFGWLPTMFGTGKQPLNSD